MREQVGEEGGGRETIGERTRELGEEGGGRGTIGERTSGRRGRRGRGRGTIGERTSGRRGGEEQLVREQGKWEKKKGGEDTCSGY